MYMVNTYQDLNQFEVESESTRDAYAVCPGKPPPGLVPPRTGSRMAARATPGESVDRGSSSVRCTALRWSRKDWGRGRLPPSQRASEARVVRRWWCNAGSTASVAPPIGNPLRASAGADKSISERRRLAGSMSSVWSGR